jgi:MYXO-CTERM domain-containing protein
MRVGFVVGVLCLGLAGSAVAAPQPLPEGDEGIAANYPGDEGIESDPEVLFADDFESYSDPSELNDRWDAVYQNDQIRLATEPENIYAGSQALEFKVPQQDQELSNATDKYVSPERDVLFLRYYSKFQPPYDVVGSSHNGSMISAHYFIDGNATPGVPANGTNKFLANLENWRGEAEVASPGLLNIYVYHPDQRSQWGDHFFPDGTVTPYDPEPFDFGPDFVPRPDIIPDLDRWYCYEYMLQANTPGERDGRIAFWFEGLLAADFHNLRLRDIDSLKIDRFGLSFHIGSNPNGETRKWYDNVVAADSYIGPIYEADDGGDGDGGDDGSDGDGDGDGGTGPGTGGGDDGGTGPGTGGDGDGEGSGTDEGATGGDEDKSGCGCRATEPRRESVLATLALLALAGFRRRRA